MSKQDKQPSKWDTYQDYLASPEWQALRDAALKRDGARCQVCGSSNEPHVHHWAYPDNLGGDSLENVVTLCAICHAGVHAHKKAKNAGEYINAVRAFADTPAKRSSISSETAWHYELAHMTMERALCLAAENQPMTLELEELPHSARGPTTELMLAIATIGRYYRIKVQE